MGADIYLNSVWNEDRNRWHASQSGYFRNSYNDSDVMWAMGLSWWGTVVPMLERGRWLPVLRARELLRIIEDRPLTDEVLVRHFSEHISSGTNEHPITGPIESILAAELLNSNGNRLELSPEFFQPPKFESWSCSVRKQRQKLITILRKSIDLGEPLDCSL